MSLGVMRFLVSRGGLGFGTTALKRNFFDDSCVDLRFFPSYYGDLIFVTDLALQFPLSVVGPLAVLSSLSGRRGFSDP